MQVFWVYFLFSHNSEATTKTKMQRPSQRPIASATTILMPKSVATRISTGFADAASLEEPIFNATIVPRSRTTSRKHRTHVNVLTLDPRIILRTLILLVAILCCIFACRLLSSDMVDDVEIYSKYTRQQLDDSKNGKERILQLLKEAGIIDLDNETLSRLPTWKEVMYVQMFMHCARISGRNLYHV